MDKKEMESRLLLLEKEVKRLKESEERKQRNLQFLVKKQFDSENARKEREITFR